MCAGSAIVRCDGGVLSAGRDRYLSEHVHRLGGHRWLIGIECRALAGYAPPAFLCVHEHIAWGASPTRAMGAFDVDLRDLGHGLRRVEVALRTMGPIEGPRPSPSGLARILADVGAAASARAWATIVRPLCDEPRGAMATVNVMEGPFGEGPIARGTITGAAAPPAQVWAARRRISGSSTASGRPSSRGTRRAGSPTGARARSTSTAGAPPR